MLSLTRKADYAIVALADLAERGAAKTSAREVSGRTGIPQPVLTNILHRLLHSGLLISTMGSKGGYQLSRPPREITLAEIIDSIEGAFMLTLCCGDEAECIGDQTCDLEPNCQIKEPVKRVNDALRQFLDKVTLAHLAFDNQPIELRLSVGANADMDNELAAIDS